jgi:hypothetical protein
MLFFALHTAAQSQKAVTDSIAYYSRKISDIRCRAADSRKYTAITTFNEIAGADYGAFNRRIGEEGYGHFGGAITRIGLGLSHMTQSGLVFDLNFSVFGIDKSSTNGSQIIQSGFADFCQADVGYAVFSSRKFDIYPYAGLSIRSSKFFFSQPPQGSSTYNDIVGVDQNKGAIWTNSVSPSYQAGVCFEWIAMISANRRLGTIAFLKAGTDGVFGRDTYKIQGINYDPGITYGNWGVAFGIKVII